jgi:hypothetical protein
MKLSFEEARFAEEFVACPDKNRAYLRAFGSIDSEGRPRTSIEVAEAATKLLELPHVQKAIEVAFDEWRTSLNVDHERVLKELAAIAFADHQDVYQECPDTGYPVPRPWNQIGVATRKSIAEIKMRRKRLTSDKDATAWEVEDIQYRFHSKDAALEKLCRYLGLLSGDKSNGNDAVVPIEVLTTIFAKLGSQRGRASGVGQGDSVGTESGAAE